MAVLDRGEKNSFNILNFLDVDEPPTLWEQRHRIRKTNPAKVNPALDGLSPENRRTREEFDHHQYEAHVQQEYLARERKQLRASGKKVYYQLAAQQRHHWGNFWFSEVPAEDDAALTREQQEVGVPVGRSKKAIAHPNDPDAHPLQTRVNGGPNFYEGEGTTPGGRVKKSAKSVNHVDPVAAEPLVIDERHCNILRTKFPPPVYQPQQEKVSAPPKRATAANSRTSNAGTTNSGVSSGMPPWQQQQPTNAMPTSRQADPPKPKDDRVFAAAMHAAVGETHNAERRAERTAKARDQYKFASHLAYLDDPSLATAPEDVMPRQASRFESMGGNKTPNQGVPGSAAASMAHPQPTHQQVLPPDGAREQQPQHDLTDWQRSAQTIKTFFEADKPHYDQQKKDEIQHQRSALDIQALTKREKELIRRRKDMHDDQRYFPGLPVGNDMRNEAQRRRVTKDELTKSWEQQLELKREKEAIYRKEMSQPSGSLQEVMMKSAPPVSQQRFEEKQQWLAPWQQRQKEMMEAAMGFGQKKNEEEAIPQHILNYSDRLVAADRMKRMEQDAYKNELDQQRMRQQQYGAQGYY